MSLHDISRPTAQRIRFYRSGPPPRQAPAWIFIVAIAILAGLVVLVPCAIPQDESRRRSLAPTVLALPPGVALDDLQKAHVLKVIAANSIEVILDGTSFLLTYFGLESPSEACAAAALSRNRDLIDGRTVLLLADPSIENAGTSPQFYVFLEDGVSVEATLVAEGLLYPKSVGYYGATLGVLAADAREQRRGCTWPQMGAELTGRVVEGRVDQ